jgi:hypothetical protein
MALLHNMNLRNSSLQRLRPGSAVDKHDGQRTCEAEECTTRLSRYNPDPVCSMHQGWAAQPAPRRAPRARATKG